MGLILKKIDENYSGYHWKYLLNYEHKSAQYLEIASFSDIIVLLRFNQHQISNRKAYKEKKFSLWEIGPITKICLYRHQNEKSRWSQGLKYF